MSKHWLLMALIALALCGQAQLAKAQSCDDSDIVCTYSLYYDSSSGMIKGQITTDYDVDLDWDLYDGSDSQAYLYYPDGTEADSDEDDELEVDDYSEADVSADSDGYGKYVLYGYYTLFVYYAEMTECLDETDDYDYCYDYLDGDVGEPETIDEVQVTLDIEPSVTITSADISTDQVLVTLTGDLPNTGTFDLRMTGTGGAEPVYILTTDETYGPGQQTFSFDQDSLQGDSGNYGEYFQLTATWTPDGGNATYTYDYHIKVLGIYTQTQYNTPAETTCTGNPTAVTIWNPSCTGFDGAVLSGFDSRVTNPQGGTGSGESIYFGGVQQEQLCSKGSGDLRGCATITGSLGPLSDSTIAVAHGQNCNDADLYVSGRNVYIRGEGVKTVTDACPACCNDPIVTGDHSHFDNYTTDDACTGIGSLPSALSVILY